MNHRAWQLREFLKRTVLKPLEKRGTCGLHKELNLPRTRGTLCRYLVYSLTFVTMCATLWTLVLGGGEVITVTFSSSNDIVKAVYKCAYENPDGSVDLVFNIPRGGEELLRLNSLSARDSAKGNKTDNSSSSEEESREKGVKGSLYPISLNSEYLINSVTVCPAGQEVDYLIIVHSATAYFARRRAIRETYGSKRLFGHLTHRLVFLLGRTSDPTATKQIQDEAVINKDIVQGRFIDSYHNLTHKGVLGFRWISEHCPLARVVIKIDDDVFLNPFKLVREVLPEVSNRSRVISCHVRKSGTSVVVRGKGKWVVHEDEFKGYKYYPFDYCNGYMVILTGDLIRPMLNAARLNPFFWIDDVYLFGILPATVGGTKFVDMRGVLTLKFDVAKTCFESKGADCKLLAVSQWRPEESERLWYTVLSNLTESAKTELHVFGKS
ncbi:unnamed protein product [Lymnaea stagnalis]|uniref:Hexosyltransferase n=1 Tax=Lymnaea stagnalis TaxID=6523 RepID=A0AAV2HT68_LYMST